MRNETMTERFIKIAVALVGSKASRSWPPEKYVILINRVLDACKEQNIRFILLGGKDANNAALYITKNVSKNVVDLTGKTTLNQAMAVMSRCNIYIGADTGLMHMASVAKIPIIELSAVNDTTPDYWGSAPTRTGPWKVRNSVIMPQKPLKGCKYFCSKNYPHCITQIEEESVFKALIAFISK